MQYLNGLVNKLKGDDPNAPNGLPNTGVSGGMPVLGAPPVADAPAPIAAPAKPSIFQSDNASVSGYLQDAAKAFAPTVRGIKDEAGRKSAVEGYMQSLAPEVQKRGGSMSGIKGEKATVDGRMIDFYRDIEGAADPQFLDVTDEKPAMAPSMGGMFGGSTISPMLQGDAQSGIQAALAGMGAGNDSGYLQKLIAQLQQGAQ